MNEPIEIPLFPLDNVVLFPGMTISIKIFEPRYKEMVSVCLETDSPFGMLFVNKKQLCNVGCTANILHAVPAEDDGTFYIHIEGIQRFHVLEHIQQKMYLEGSIEYFDDVEEDIPDELLTRVLDVFQEMIKLETKGVGGVKGIFDPKQFSFLIASLVQMDLPDKQTLLELTSTIERMRKLETAIEDINPLLKKLLEKDRIIGMNGHTKHEDEE